MNRMLMLAALANMGSMALAASESVVVLNDGEDRGYKPPKRQARSIPPPPQERKEKSSSLKRLLKGKGRK